MRTKLLILVLCPIVLCACNRNPAVSSALTATPASSVFATDHFSGVVTEIVPMTSDSGTVQVTFLMSDGEYRQGEFSSADGVSVGDEVTVSNGEIVVTPSAPKSYDAVTMPALLATIENAVPSFTDNHTLGNANRAADFTNMTVSDIQNALVILPNGTDTTALCYIITSKPEDAVRGFTDYTDAIQATYEDDPYAPSACDGACALVKNAYIDFGDDWALLVIAPDDEKAKLVDAVTAWQEKAHD